MAEQRKHIAVISHWGFKSLHGGNLRAYFLISELLRLEHKVTLLLANNDDVDHCKKLFGCDAVSVNEPMSRWQSVGKKMFQYLVFGHKHHLKADPHNLREKVADRVPSRDLTQYLQEMDDADPKLESSTQSIRHPV